jgi:hypothetical protein
MTDAVYDKVLAASFDGERPFKKNVTPMSGRYRKTFDFI